MPHLTLYDQLGDMPINLGPIVGRGVVRSQLGAEVPNLRQISPMTSGRLGAPLVPSAQNGSSQKKWLGPPPLMTFHQTSNSEDLRDCEGDILGRGILLLGARPEEANEERLS